jgi:adenylate cyclase
MHVCSWSNLQSFNLDKAEQQVAHALTLDPTDPEAHRVMGAIKMKSNDFVSARYHHERAYELAPHDAYILGRSAAFYVYVGEPEAALEMLDRAEALDPFLPVWITEERVAALYMLGRFDQLSRMAQTLPFQTRRTLIYQVAANIAQGDSERAQLLMRQALALDPTLSSQYISTQETYADPSVTEKLIRRNGEAGLPIGCVLASGSPAPR